MLLNSTRHPVPANAHRPGGVRARARPIIATSPSQPQTTPRVVSAGAAASDAARQPSEKSAAAPTVVTLNTVVCGKQKAYWLGPSSAMGVVLVLHGFAQSPLAYAELCQQLAAQGLLVVAPDPQPIVSTSVQELQAAIVESAAFWRQKLRANAFPPVKLADAAAARRTGLLGHSVGAGIATFVAKQAAIDGQEFEAVMFMAPQTQVFAAYEPAAAIKDWPQGARATAFSLQYGWADLIAPFWLATTLRSELEAAKFKVAPVTAYPLGTHVGFEDQLFLGDLDVDEQLLPGAGLVLLLLAAAIALGLRGVDPVPLLRYMLLKSVTLRDLWASLQPRGGEGAVQQGQQQQQRMVPRDVLAMPARSSSTPEGLSAAEKALVLLQMAVAGERFQAGVQQQQEQGQQQEPVEGTETVRILSPLQSWLRYLWQLQVPVTVLWGVSAAAARATEGRGGVLHALLAGLELLLGLLSAGGAAALAVQVAVDLWQRPQARVAAAAYFKGALCVEAGGPDAPRKR